MNRATQEIMISAGEASGDAHAAHALQCMQKSLHAKGEAVVAFGMGGTQLESAGCELVVDSRDLSVIGFVDVIKNYPKFLKRLARLREVLTRRKPALLLIVDYPDFNLKLAETAKQLGIPVLMYVAPQVWAWRAGRIPRIAQRVSHMAVLFPFEVPIWTQAGLDTTHVGHPMAHTIDTEASVSVARSSVGVADGQTLLGLLPGSRLSEIKRLLPMMVQVADKVAAQHPSCRFALPVAPSIDRDLIDHVIADTRASSDTSAPTVAAIDIYHHTEVSSTQVMRAADLALVASGTATLETGLVGTPMVVVYAVSKLNALLMRRLIKIPNLALVNIVAERRIVPELIQEDAQAHKVAKAVIELLDNPTARQQMRHELVDIKHKLGGKHASEEVAALMIKLASPSD